MIVRIFYKTSHNGRDWVVFKPVQAILSRGVGEELDGRVIESIVRAAGRRQARGELTRAAVEMLLKERVVDALGQEAARRMDEQGLHQQNGNNLLPFLYL